MAHVSGTKNSFATQQPPNCLRKSTFAPVTWPGVGRTGSTIISTASAVKHFHLLLPMAGIKALPPKKGLIWPHLFHTDAGLCNSHKKTALPRTRIPTTTSPQVHFKLRQALALPAWGRAYNATDRAVDNTVPACCWGFPRCLQAQRGNLASHQKRKILGVLLQDQRELGVRDDKN